MTRPAQLERVSTWADPAAIRPLRSPILSPRLLGPAAASASRSGSEKGTVRGVLAPVLDHYAVGFRVVHGFSSATTVHDIAQDDDGRDADRALRRRLRSERHVHVGGGPARAARQVRRRSRHAEADCADAVEQVSGLPSFPAADKQKDPRYKWFVANYGDRCWELDAMDPNDLRDCVEQAISKLIEPVAWQRCEVVNKAEQESLQTVLEQWGVAP